MNPGLPRLSVRAFAFGALALIDAPTLIHSAEPTAALRPEPAQGEHIVLLGNALGERMQYYGHFETLLHRRFAEKNLTIRNLCQSGDTPAYRPRAGRASPWAFPGGEKYRGEYVHLGRGHYPPEDEWLKVAQADTILAFFGFNESFDGPERAPSFAAELTAFVDHTLAQTYNGRGPPRLVLVAPIAFENLSGHRDLPDGKRENATLALYTKAMREVAAAKKVGFVDLFSLTSAWFTEGSASAPFTINGAHLSDAGYRRLAPPLVEALYGPGSPTAPAEPEALRKAVNDKNWFWRNDYRMLNGVHAYGRRYGPFGGKNYPQEIEKIRQMTVLRDEHVWQIARSPLPAPPIDDSRTRPLDPVETNFTQPIKYLGKDDALSRFTLPEGYKIELFAAESEFPDLRNPVQMTFDNRGRLWVAVMPSYPHYRPGDAMPDDKLLIFEDTDGDGRADRQTIFARGLHLPTGFELAPEGVYLSQQPNLILLRDLDGDDRADTTEYLLHGFDSHDTHHAIHAFVADGSGAFYLHEGRFLHSQVETPYGCIRSNDGGIYRFDPKSWRIERFSQYDYSNPWGMAFDQWGQNFLSDASPGNNYWLLPLTLKLPFGVETPEATRLTQPRLRPTAGTEFVYSRHFPDEVQGDFLVNNTIGFLGTRQHAISEDGAGFKGETRFELVTSSDPNFRPVDMEFAPDGSLYLIDWHNALIGHMQHSVRDPNRDHEHGRIYRVTYPARPLVQPAMVAGESIPVLLDHLKLPEYRTRYRAHRELRGRPASEVLPVVRRWVAALDATHSEFERHLLEALWVTWGQNQIDRTLLERCLTGDAHPLRAAAVRVLRHDFRKIPNHVALLRKAAADAHPRVRLEALVASSWVGGEAGAEILLEALQHPLDHWMEKPARYAMIPLQSAARALVKTGRFDVADNPVARDYLSRELRFDATDDAAGERIPPDIATRLGETGSALWKLGSAVYHRDGHCATCHQKQGEGVPKIYPPLANSEWLEDEERLIKIVLHGMTGDITVRGQIYKADTIPPMPGFAALLTDKEVAGVVTYVRSMFAEKMNLISAERVKTVRAATAERKSFYTADELLAEPQAIQRKGKRQPQ